MAKKLRLHEVEALKEKLLKRKREVWQEVRDLLRREVDEEYQDLVDTALDKEDWSIIVLKEETVLSLIEPKRNELEEIEEALSRIEQGNYGLCIDCSGPIGAQRLEIMPETPRCAKCQAALEKARRK